ncbi:MAG: hypothetical protein NVS4B3_23570 [Gemmatimonadaceae bacterium]
MGQRSGLVGVIFSIPLPSLTLIRIERGINTQEAAAVGAVAHGVLPRDDYFTATISVMRMSGSLANSSGPT